MGMIQEHRNKLDGLNMLELSKPEDWEKALPQLVPYTYFVLEKLEEIALKEDPEGIPKKYQLVPLSSPKLSMIDLDVQAWEAIAKNWNKRNKRNKEKQIATDLGVIMKMSGSYSTAVRKLRKKKLLRMRMQ